MRRLFFALLFLFHYPALCQNINPVAANTVSQLKSFYKNHTIEKAYLQFNKPYYTIGDTVYFKAYVTFGEQHELSVQSGVLNVDLIGPKRKIVRSIKLRLNGGITWGDFVLNDTLSKGCYSIRAYTQLMRDAGLTDFFEQPISVVTNNNYKNNIKNSGQPDIQFFPEGGNLVAGINSKVAFKALNSEGLGLNVKGVIVDNSGKTITTFNSTHLGMGFFNLLPETGKTYKTKVDFEGGKQSLVDLPVAAEKGVILALDNTDPDAINIMVSCTQSYFNENQNKELNLVINSGVTVSNGRIKLSNPLFATAIKKSQFRTGVVQFTLFSPEGEPLCERLLFVKRSDMLNLSLKTNKESFKQREKTVADFTVTDKKDSLALGHFSVAVINETKTPFDENNENTILSWLLLSSDVKGHIEQPNYYFNSINAETAANLDILMLTQGYRRFMWKKLLANGYPVNPSNIESGIEIQGRLTTLKGTPIIKEPVNLISLGGGGIIKQVTDSLGNFRFTGLDFDGITSFMVKAGSEKNKNNVRVTLNNFKPAPVTGRMWCTHYLGTDSALNENNSFNVASSFAFRDTIPRENLKRPGLVGDETADQILYGKDLGEGDLTSKLAAALNDIQFINGNFFLRPSLTSTITNAESTYMLIIVDGVRGASLNGMLTNDVEKVEVLKNNNANVYGGEGNGGVLIITTKSGKDLNNITSVGVLHINPEGFYKAREYYSPKYETGTSYNTPDFRTSIYWKPEIQTDKDGKAAFEYFNADDPDTYKIIIEGIDTNGNIGRQVYRYKVE